MSRTRLPRLVLASASPQRWAILAQLGIPFEIVVSGVEELEAPPAAQTALENARRKALAVAAEHPGAAVLGVDTMVELDGLIYGKPKDATEARSTLVALSGRVHEVVSGICLSCDGARREAVARTSVRFRVVAADLLDWYLAGGEWRDRAGGYAIQGRGAALVEAIDGDYWNVVGLPVPALLELAPELLG
jgi:septum formation protein